MTKACQHHERYLAGDRVQCSKFADSVNVSLCGQCQFFELAPLKPKSKRKRAAQIGSVMTYLLKPIGTSCSACQKSAAKLNQMKLSDVWKQRKTISQEIIGRVTSRPDLVRWKAIRLTVQSLPGMSRAAVICLLLFSGLIASLKRKAAQ